MNSPRERAEQRGRSLQPGLTASLAIGDVVASMVAP
jgi:hypothetical protein